LESGDVACRSSGDDADEVWFVFAEAMLRGIFHERALDMMFETVVGLECAL
jgi:hypothetical protein